MSRTNTRVARNLRNEESLQLRKRILKNRGAYDPNEVFQTLTDSDNKYNERLQKLSQFRQKSKTTTKEQNLKLLWQQEYQTLASAANKALGETKSLVQNLILSSPGDGAMQDLANMMSEDQDNREEDAKQMISQWHEIKQMVNDFLKMVSKQSQKLDANSSMRETEPPTSTLQSVNEDDSNDELIDRQNLKDSQTADPLSNILARVPVQWQKSVSILASILVDLRSIHYSKGVALRQEEEELVKTVINDRNKLSLMSKLDTISQQDESLRQILTLNGDDDAETEMFMDEWIFKIRELDMEHTTNASAIQEERLMYCTQLGLSPDDRNGGWVAEDHDIFTKIFRRFTSAGLPRKTFTQLLRTELPSHPPEDLESHEEWFRRMRFWSQRIKELGAEYESRREELLTQARSELNQFRNNQRDNRLKEIEQKQHELHREALHNKLATMRQEKSILDQEHELQQQIEKLKEDQRLAELTEAQRKDHEMKKAKVEEYRRKLVEQQEERKKYEEELENQRMQLLRENVEKNRAQVEARNHQIQAREEERKRLEALEAEREAHRMELLAKLAEQVPYFEAIQNAHSKLDHITASVENQKYVKLDFARGYIPMFGFADKNIIRDARFRLASALREAGVIHSAAAREAINHFHPRPHLAIHGIL